MPYAVNGQISQAPLEGGIPIYDEQYQEALAGVLKGWVVSIDGGFSVAAPVEPEPEPTPEPTLDELASSAMSRINGAYQAEMNEILRAYPEAETLTWDKQEQEARKWSADNTAATPLLDAIAQGRGMDKTELVSRVIAKADAWIAASGLATGKRQALEDEITAALAADDRAAIEAIKW